MAEKKAPKNVEKLIAKAEAGKAAKRAKEDKPKPRPRAAKELRRLGDEPKRAPTHVLTLITKHLGRGK